MYNYTYIYVHILFYLSASILKISANLSDFPANVPNIRKTHKNTLEFSKSFPI